MNHNCIVHLTRDGVVIPAIHGNKLCQECFDLALAAIVAEDRRTKSPEWGMSARLHRERRERRRRVAQAVGR